jgi:hypothetical protein
MVLKRLYDSAARGCSQALLPVDKVEYLVYTAIGNEGSLLGGNGKRRPVLPVYGDLKPAQEEALQDPFPAGSARIRATGGALPTRRATGSRSWAAVGRRTRPTAARPSGPAAFGTSFPFLAPRFPLAAPSPLALRSAVKCAPAPAAGAHKFALGLPSPERGKDRAGDQRLKSQNRRNET